MRWPQAAGWKLGGGGEKKTLGGRREEKRHWIGRPPLPSPLVCGLGEVGGREMQPGSVRAFSWTLSKPRGRTFVVCRPLG